MGLDPVSMSGVENPSKYIFLASFCNTSSLSWSPEDHSGISKRCLHVLVLVRLDSEVVRGGKNTRGRRVKRFPCENE